MHSRNIKDCFISFSLGEVKNALAQSDYIILVSTIFQVRCTESTWFRHTGIDS